MNDFRWINQSQPQTLFGATILCYIDAAFGLINSGGFLLLLLLAVALGAGGVGVANERKWGYALGVTAAVAQLALFLWFFGFNVLGFPLIITLMFDGLLVALLVHPLSRDYQRIYFH